MIAPYSLEAARRTNRGGANRGLTDWIESMRHATLFRGHGRFESARTVRVGDELLEADKIFVNVGTRARVPALPGLDEAVGGCERPLQAKPEGRDPRGADLHAEALLCPTAALDTAAVLVDAPSPAPTQIHQPTARSSE